MIIHFTTAHPRDDSRIRYKELASLREAFGGPVALYVQDGLGDEVDTRMGVRIVDTGPSPKGRFARMLVGGWRMFNALRRVRPQVAHFHDPELLLWAIPLGLWGIKVVYDAHDDVPRQIMHGGLPRWARLVVSPIAAMVEWLAARLLAGIVAATPIIVARFPKRKVALVHNYPILNELSLPTHVSMADRPIEFAYVGTINQNRSIFTMIEAVGRLPIPTARLRLAGEFILSADREAAERMPPWSRVKYDGWLTRDEIAALLGQARAGIVLFKPLPFQKVALPIKLFEYMAAGLPIICSDFPLWREMIEDRQCGILVDPENLDAIAAAMQWIVDHPDQAEAMGERARRTVMEKYNWETEKRKLIDFYSECLGMRPREGAVHVS